MIFAQDFIKSGDEIKANISSVPISHTCNPSYSGDKVRRIRV
jgi:hypothetical protein